MGETSSVSRDDGHVDGDKLRNECLKLSTAGIVRDVHQVQAAGKQAVFLDSAFSLGLEEGFDLADKPVYRSIVKLFNGSVGGVITLIS